MKTFPTSNSRRRAAGFTLVEILVAIGIGLFLIGGLLTLVQAMRRTNTNQSGLSNLQDNERMAMQLITDVVQSTGYFVNPLTSSAVAAFPIATYGTASFTFAGQGLVGTTPSSDVITSRYQTNGSDNVINCTGNTNTTATPAAPVTWANQFSITTVGGISYLTCQVWANGVTTAAVPLIPNITAMSISYGVTTGQGSASNSVDTYLAASAMTSAYWGQVRSVMVTLTFPNPMFGQPGQTAATVTFTRVIDVMNKNGVTTT
jgi:type IV pilus assembly protein PilW